MKRILLSVSLLGIFVNANAYELATHARLSQHSIQRSTLTDGSVLVDVLGLKDTSTDILGDHYYDLLISPDGSVKDITERFKKSYSTENKRIPDNVDSISIQGWLMRGAIREDDLPCPKSPCDDPVNTVRVKHHFYDPVNNQALLTSAQKSPDWALGVSAFLADANTPNEPRQNHFSWFDAKEALYRALTGRSTAGAADIGPGNSAVTEAVRKAYWATTFRALGGVLHHVQDMAQPQHTRNEFHIFDVDHQGHQFYEKYTNQKFLGARIKCANGQNLTPALHGSTYDIPRFNRATDYFTTRTAAGNDAITARRGIADFSNREFLTPNSNLGSNPQNLYTLPSRSVSAYKLVEVESQVPCMPLNTFTQTLLLTKKVTDANAPGYANQTIDPVTGATISGAFIEVPLSTLGMWARTDDENFFTTLDTGFAITEYNYDAMADLLIPRAEAYGAGLLDYFFRGRLEITLPDAGIYGVMDMSAQHSVSNMMPIETASGEILGFRKLIMKVRNSTPDIVDGQTSHAQDMGAGTLRAVARYRFNPCYTIDLSGMKDCAQSTIDSIPDQDFSQSVSESIDVTSVDAINPQEYEFDFSAEPIPVNATDLRIQVVFEGALGAETDHGVAVGMQDISEPTYFISRNTTDYFSYYGQRYRVDDPPDHPEYMAEFVAAWRDENADFIPDAPATNWQAENVGPVSVRVGNIQNVVSINVLEPGQYIRTAHLADPGPLFFDVDVPGYFGPSASPATTIWQEQAPGVDYYHDDTRNMGDGTNYIYYWFRQTTLHEAYPSGSAHGPEVFPHFDPGPGPLTATICFPENDCTP